MQANKDVLLKQEKELKHELLEDDLPKHRRTEAEALLYLVDAQLRDMGMRYWWE